ncbi:MAG: hypothetical protein J5924_00820 [Bacteroidaceae bacterium]|nr:hypothetical protein [Bacteroidaceae bacterium]
MKALRKHWLQGTSKVLSAAIALLGLAGCGTSKRAVDPPVVMYGAPYEGAQNCQTRHSAALQKVRMRCV